MSDELSFNPGKAVFLNIVELSKLESFVAERKLCEFRDLAFEMADFSSSLFQTGLSAYEILSLLADNLSFSNPQIHDIALHDNIAKLRLYLNRISCVDKAMLCSIFLDELEKCGIVFDDNAFLLPQEKLAKFAYAKNPYSDEAFDVFSEEFESPAVLYAPDFRTALKMLSANEVGFCILPLEDKGVRLPTVSELIQANDLKIVSVTPVLGFDGFADMKFALVSDSFINIKTSKNDDRYLEIRLDANDDLPISELLSASDMLGMDVYRINTESFGTYYDKKDYISVVFKDGGNGFVPLLTYLTLFSSSYTPVGIYKNLE